MVKNETYQSVKHLQEAGNFLSLLDDDFDSEKYIDSLNYIQSNLFEHSIDLDKYSNSCILSFKELESIYEYISIVHDQLNDWSGERFDLLGVQLRFVLDYLFDKYPIFQEDR